MIILYKWNFVSIVEYLAVPFVEKLFGIMRNAG